LYSVEVTEDTKIPNAATIKIVKQDHTLANMIRGCVPSPLPSLCSPTCGILFSQLHAMPQVLFAGYKVPHPLHPYFLVKIQTDGTITPTAALDQACTKLIGTLSSLEAKFKREFSFKDVEGVATEDPYGALNAGPTWASGRDYMDF
jgi:DNA-directed RNA polymerase II subunit RPB11